MEMAKLEVAILATDYTNNVLAIRVTNIPVPVRGTPAVPVWPVTANIINVYAQVVTVGMVAVALFPAPLLINTLVLVSAMPEVPAPSVVENIPPVPAPAAMSGMVAVAKKKIKERLLGISIIVMVRSLD